MCTGDAGVGWFDGLSLEGADNFFDIFDKLKGFKRRRAHFQFSMVHGTATMGPGTKNKYFPRHLFLIFRLNGTVPGTTCAGRRCTTTRVRGAFS